jgi:hypothetical protein
MTVRGITFGTVTLSRITSKRMITFTRMTFRIIKLIRMTFSRTSYKKDSSGY